MALDSNTAISTTHKQTYETSGIIPPFPSTYNPFQYHFYYFLIDRIIIEPHKNLLQQTKGRGKDRYPTWEPQWKPSNGTRSSVQFLPRKECPPPHSASYSSVPPVPPPRTKSRPSPAYTSKCRGRWYHLPRYSNSLDNGTESMMLKITDCDSDKGEIKIQGELHNLNKHNLETENKENKLVRCKIKNNDQG